VQPGGIDFVPQKEDRRKDYNSVPPSNSNAISLIPKKYRPRAMILINIKPVLFRALLARIQSACMIIAITTDLTP
jgi:hypothetical protein